jgi:predicted RNA-binding protein YlxR (DUF448 family)
VLIGSTLGILNEKAIDWLDQLASRSVWLCDRKFLIYKIKNKKEFQKMHVKNVIQELKRSSIIEQTSIRTLNVLG